MSMRTRLNELDERAGLAPRHPRDVSAMLVGGLFAFLSASNLLLVLDHRDARHATLFLVLDILGVLLGLAVVAYGLRSYRARPR